MTRKVADMDARGRPRVQTFNNEESRTVQSDRTRADIREVISRYRKTGLIEGLRDVAAEYRDVTAFTDLADAMRQAKVAERAFMALPSKVREVFHHDVAEWLDTAFDQDKMDSLIRRGLMDPPDGWVDPSPPSPAPTVEGA